MAKKLYYVVKPDLEDIDGIKETNGNKTVVVYSVVNGEIKEDFYIEGDLTENSQEMIKGYINDNGMGDDEFKLIEL